MTRYTSEINKKRLNLYHHTLLDLYKSIRTSTRFRFEVDYLDDQLGPYSIVLTAKFFDFFDYADEKIYRYYILSNEKRRDLVQHIESFDNKLRQISDKECLEHLEKQGYRQHQIYLADDLAVKALRELEIVMTIRTDTSTKLFDVKHFYDEKRSKYWLDKVEYTVLCTCYRTVDNKDVREFLVMSERKEVTVSDMKALVKSIRFKGTELIQKIPKEKRAKDEDSLMYKNVMDVFGNYFWDNMILVDVNHLMNDEILIYLGINNHTLLQVQNINIITEKDGDAFLRFY